MILFGFGALIGAASLEFWPLWLAASMGAIAGDVGLLLDRPPLPIRGPAGLALLRHPEMVANGERFFHRFGPWAVFIGRFFGPARAVIPLVAGIFAMPAILFMAANVASAFVWAFVMLAPGAGLSNYLSW